MLTPTQTLPENYVLKGTLDLHTNRKAALGLSLAGVILLVAFAALFGHIFILMRPQDAEVLTRLEINGLRGVLVATLAALGINAVMAVLHEAVHGLFFRLFTGARPRFAFKLWYAYTAAPAWYLPRNLYFVVAVAPLLGLTALGLALMAVAPVGFFWPLMLFLTLNAGGSVGDMAVAGWLLMQPSSCLANDRGDAVTLYLPERA